MASDNVNLTPALNPLPLKDNQGGALNLTRITGLGAALVAVLITFNGAWTTIFGAETPRWAKPVVIMAVIATFAIVAAADILARGYTAGQTKRAGPTIFQLPKGLRATYLVGPDQEVALTAVRERPEDLQFLIVMDDKTTAWVAPGDLRFN